MILERLVIENFRQFKGRQEIVFSDLRERNVTIVHAENGFGKQRFLKHYSGFCMGVMVYSAPMVRPMILKSQIALLTKGWPSVLRTLMH